jgi:cell division inhibitor SulA
MGAVVALDPLFNAGRIWRGQPVAAPALPAQPTGHPDLDAALPAGGWPDHALSEILLRADGTGELSLVFPTLVRLTQASGRVVLIAPPYLPHAPAWARAGVELKQLQVVRAEPRDALWAAEQCLRLAACAAVLCWPREANDKTLRRLQVAAQTGQCLGFAFRDARHAENPSPAAVRVLVEREGQARVLKCRGGNAPARPLPFRLQ